MRGGFSLQYCRIWEVTLVSQLVSVVLASKLLHSSGFEKKSASNFWVGIFGSFRLRIVLEWSFCMVFAHIVYSYFVGNWQSLFRVIENNPHDSNGYAVAVGELLVAFTMLGFTKIHVLAQQGSRWITIISTMFFSGLALYSMAISLKSWQVYVSYVLYLVSFRIGEAAAISHVGSQVQEKAASVQDNGSLLDLRDSSPKPRVAFVFASVQFVGSCLQIVVQFFFQSAHWPMPLRFEAFAVMLWIVAAIFFTIFSASFFFQLTQTLDLLEDRVYRSLIRDWGLDHTLHWNVSMLISCITDTCSSLTVRYFAISLFHWRCRA